MRHGRLLVALVAAVLFIGVVQPVAGSASTSKQQSKSFLAGAAVESISPPAFGAVTNDPADCDASASGPRNFAYEEAYTDTAGIGTYQLGDPFVDCNGNGRWDGILLGGGADSPRFATTVADDISARALVVSNGPADDRDRGARPRGSLQHLSGSASARRSRPTATTSTTSSSPRRTTSRRPTRLASPASTRRCRVSTRTTSTSSSINRRRRSSTRTTNSGPRGSSTRRRSSPPIFSSASRRTRSSTTSSCRRCKPSRRTAR